MSLTLVNAFEAAWPVSVSPPHCPGPSLHCPVRGPVLSIQCLLLFVGLTPPGQPESPRPRWSCLWRLPRREKGCPHPKALEVVRVLPSARQGPGDLGMASLPVTLNAAAIQETFLPWALPPTWAREAWAEGS